MKNKQWEEKKCICPEHANDEMCQVCIPNNTELFSSEHKILENSLCKKYCTKKLGWNKEKRKDCRNRTRCADADKMLHQLYKAIENPEIIGCLILIPSHLINVFDNFIEAGINALESLTACSDLTNEEREIIEWMKSDKWKPVDGKNV